MRQTALIANTEGKRTRRDIAVTFAAGLLACVGGSILLYRLFPAFLLQHHDGMHAYALLQTLYNWSSFTIGMTASPMEGMMTFSYPLSVYLTPHLWPFMLSGDPNSQIFWIYVAYSGILYASCHFLFSALKLPAVVVVPASLLAVLFWTTQQDPHIAGLQGGLLYYVNVILGIFALCGRFEWRVNVLFLAGFAAATILMLSADASTSVLGLPTLAIVGCSLLLAASRREAAWKLAAVVTTFAVLVMAGFPEYMILLFRGTARVYFGNVISLQTRSFHVAGLPYHPSYFGLGLYVLSVVSVAPILIVSRAVALPRAMINLSVALAGFMIVWAVVGYLYVKADLDWLGPAPWYYQWASYPLMALLPVCALYLACQSKRATAVTQLTIFVTLIILVILALLTAPPHLLPYTIAACVIGVIVFIGLAIARRTPLLVVALGATVVYIAVHSPFEWADKRPDMHDRLSLKRLPVIDFLSNRAALSPNQPFRGYVDDFYSGGSPTNTMLDEILKHWHENLGTYGNGLRTFGWQAFHIPTLSQYNTFMTPDYFWFYSRLHNTAQIKQSVSMIALTHPNLTMLAAMGASYLVTNADHPELSRLARPVFSWNGIKVNELVNPNLMSYSPTEVQVVRSWPAAMDVIANPAFDPTTSLVLDDEPPQSGPFRTARTVDAYFISNGFHLRVEAAGPAILLLPVQFSHCYRVTQGRAHIARANIAMTALFVEGNNEIEVALTFGPFGRSSCRRRDLEELDRHLPTDLSPSTEGRRGTLRLPENHN